MSYRDPNLAATNEIYDRIPEYREAFEADEREMTKYIIGTISDMDTPRTPAMEGSRGLASWLTQTTLSDIQKYRDEVLDAQPEDIRALAGGIRELLGEGAFCAIGNEGKIEKEKELFDTTFRLFGA